MAALVEVHDEREAKAPCGWGAGRRRPTTVTCARRDRPGSQNALRPLIPSEVVLVAESGSHSVDDARRLREAGADAILVGGC